MASDMPRVLVVGEMVRSRVVLRELLQGQAMQVVEASDGPTAMSEAVTSPPDAVLIDLETSDANGHALLSWVKQHSCDTPFVILAALDRTAEAVEMVRAGALSYLTRPWVAGEILQHVRAALRNGKPAVTAQPRSAPTLQDLMGHSESIRALAREVECVAPTNFSVVIIGETGVGKELVAREIHLQSLHPSAPFVAVDSGAIPETLIESELFGHERGSFTGADRMRRGKFEAATGGAIFLDEIANLSYAMQSKLLRVLQERRFCRVGGSTAISVNVRVIAATHEELGRADPAAFRSDLYHRLGEYIIHVPPLRDRKEDVLALVKRFVDGANEELGKRVQGLTRAATDVLLAYNWPGNVRELRNVIRRGVLLAPFLIDTDHLSMAPPRPTAVSVGPDGPRPQPGSLSLREILHRHTMEVERCVIWETLKQTGGNKAQAARLLHIDYKTIHSKVKKYGLPKEGQGNER
jgi:DNA-binding NtrC family response regulator